MLQAAIGDAPLAFLDHRVLFGDAAHARIGDVLLVLAVDQIIVGAIAYGNEIRIDFGNHAMAAAEFLDFVLRQRPIRIPGIGIDPAIFIVDRHPCVAEMRFARQRRRRCTVRWQSELRAAPIAHAMIGTPRAANHETHVVIDDQELRQRVLANPAQPFFIGRGIRIGIGRHARRRHMQEGEMRSIKGPFDGLRPIALLQFLGDETVGRRQGSELELRHLRQRFGPRVWPHIGPDHVAIFARRIGFETQALMIACLRRHVRQFQRPPLQIELPTVEDAANGTILIAAEIEIGAAMRTARIDEPDHTFAVAESNQVFAHDGDAQRRTIRLRQFTR